MRLFIAIELSPEVREELENAKKELAKLHARLVPKENLHITLKFLGEVADEKVPGILIALRDTKFAAFRVHLEKAGAFPDEKKASVIWVSVEPSSQLSRVKDLVDKELPKFIDDKPFKSHITIARADGVDVKDAIAKINAKLQEKEMLATKITLYKSILTTRGAMYTKLL